MILRWTDSRDGLEHETYVDRVEFRPDGTVEGYRLTVVPLATRSPAGISYYLSERKLVVVQQLEPGDVQGRVLVVER